MQGAEKAWQVVVGLRRTHQSRDKLCQFPGRAGLILGSKVRASLLSFSSSFFFFSQCLISSFNQTCCAKCLKDSG